MLDLKIELEGVNSNHLLPCIHYKQEETKLCNLAANVCFASKLPVSYFRVLFCVELQKEG